MLKLYKPQRFLTFLLLINILATALASLNAQWEDWQWRRAVSISNTSGNALSDFQTKIVLNSSTPFDFTKAKSDGSDLRITASDGITALPFWIESWNQAGQQATIWVKVPSIPYPSGTTIYIYYGNSTATNAENGDNTFDFFDDFESSVTEAPGYYTFGPASTIMVREPSWGEGTAPHSLSVVKAPEVGAYNNYIYYGYYGPQGSGYIGIAGSNDLLTWTRFPYNPPPGTGINNPLIVGNNVRWPSVYWDASENKYYMVHTVNYGSSYIVYRESTDGLTWSAPTTIVPYDVSNQNPSLFHDLVGGKYYLYWYRAANGWSIMAREANTVAGLVSAPNVELLRSSTTLAAPQVLYYDNTYFLSTEIFEGVWKVRIYSGTSPLGPFTILPGNPVLSDGCACLFQHLFNGNIYEYYCKETSGTWTLDMRVVDPSTGRIMYEQGELDVTKWTPSGGSWNVISALEPNGNQGIVAQGITSANTILKSSFSGNDYILEGYGKQISSRVWGFAIRTTDLSNKYTLNLYEDLDITNNLYFYRWRTGYTTATVWNTGLGSISLNTWYKLMIKAHGNNFDIYFNDVFKATTSDNSFANGSIALYGENGTVANFDDIRVRKYVATEPTTNVGVEIPAAGFNVYLNSSTSASAGIIYPNVSWGMPNPLPPGYPGTPVNDWDLTAPINLYIVPEVDAVFGASDITIEWDNTMYGYSGVENSGIFAGANFQFLHSTNGTTDQVIINAARTDNTNFTITAGQYIAKLNLNLLKPDFGPVSLTTLDFRAFNGLGGQLGVYMTGNNAEVKSYLGDVGAPGTPSLVESTGDGEVNGPDLVLWSYAYWSGVGTVGMDNYKVKYDIGPTDDNTVYGIPDVDGEIQFEDLVIFAMSYGLSAGNVYPKIEAEPTEPVDLQLGEPVIAGSQTRVPLYVSGGVQNVRAMSLTFAGQFGKLVGVEKGSMLTEFTNPVMVMSNTDGNQVFVDLAVFGAEELGINQEGEVLTLIFEGNTEISLSTAEVRNILNHTMAVDISGTDGLVPSEFALLQNYPNPFNPTTTINYALPTQAMVEVSVFNALGERVATLVNEIEDAGRHTVEFNAVGYSSGIYFYQIKANDFISVKKMILMK